MSGVDVEGAACGAVAAQDPGVLEHGGLREALNNWNDQLIARLTSLGLSPLQGIAVLGAMIVPLLNDSASAQYDAEVVLDDLEVLLAAVHAPGLPPRKRRL
jgi:hypothetical protein